MLSKQLSKDLVIATRFYDGTKDKSITPFILRWVDAAKALRPKGIIIAIATEFDLHESASMLRNLQIQNLHVREVSGIKVRPTNNDFGSYLKNSPILNCLVDTAVECGGRYLMSQSIHHEITKQGVEHLLRQFDNHTVCCGPVLYVHEGFFQPGLVEGHGGTCPINTLAIWDLKYLGPIGFPLIIDAADNRYYSENEELVTIAHLMRCFTYEKLVAKLVRTPGITSDPLWYSKFPERKNKYSAKGKTEQMHWQCDRLGLPYPKIHHIGD